MAYEYTLPQGYFLRPETKVKLDALVNKCKLSQEDAQAFVDVHVELIAEYNNAMCAAMVQLANANNTAPKRKPVYHQPGMGAINYDQLSKRNAKGGRNKSLRKQ